MDKELIEIPATYGEVVAETAFDHALNAYGAFGGGRSGAGMSNHSNYWLWKSQQKSKPKVNKAKRKAKNKIALNSRRKNRN